MPQSIIRQGNGMDMIKAWAGMKGRPEPFGIGFA